MSIISLVSLFISILGTAVYVSLFKGSGLTWLFVILSFASIILPPVSKKIRINSGKKGKSLEIFAIIIGGFNFYCVIYALTTLPIVGAYIGWIVCGLAYMWVI